MSRHRLRHFVTALICGLVPLIPAAPVHASSQLGAKLPVNSAPAESAVLRKFRDSGPPVMEKAAQFESTAPVQAFAPRTAVKSQTISTVSNPRLYREVFGFAFASSLGDPTIGYPSWNFSLLSTVAYFGIHVDWTGDFSGGSALNTWNDPNGPVPGFIQTAHANGTKVVLTIAMFDSTSGTPNMCSALQRSDVTIQRTVAEVAAKGIDGVNVDYESNNTTCTEPGTGIVASSQSLFTTFVKNLRAALPAGSYLSVDTYSGAAGFRDSSGAYLGFFDIGALANYADSFFVMAYDMEYSNWSAPPLSCSSFCLGPTAPVTNYLFNDTRASSEYRAVVPASKIIMGIPYYGRKECVAVPDPNSIPPNAVGSSVAADGYLDASTENTFAGNTLYATHRDAIDPAGATRWDTFSSVSAGCNRELYWDDATALGNKYNLVINDHLRGAGIFALNYGGGSPELWSLINLKFGQCSEAAIASDHTIPQIPGASITFTGTALCAGTGTYRFWMQPPGGAFTVVQDFSTANTWSWNTTSSTPLGTYTFQVDAKNQGASPPAGYDTQSRTSFRLALCVTPTLTADLAAPKLPGTAITFSSTVTCQGTPEYQYWVQPPGGAWTMAQDYSAAATFRWDTTHLGYGDYNIGVHVRTTGTTVAYESTQSIQYSLRSCISAALSTDKASPQPTGTQVAMSGTATCDGAPQYRFMIQPPGGSWSVVQDFATSATFAWVGGAVGTYNLELDVKSTTAPAASMSSTQVGFNFTGCSAVSLASNPPSPQQQPAQSVVLTASATCPGTPQYRFWIHKPDGSVGVVQDYGAANTYTWSATGLPLGQYGLRVDVRDAGATTSTYEAVALANYWLSEAACTTPSVAMDLPAPQGINTVVTFTATTTTCVQPQFEFWLRPPGTTSSWILAQGYSPTPTFHWNTSGAAAGDYTVEVWVRDLFSGTSTSSDRGTWDGYLDVADTLTSTPCAAPAVSASPPYLPASGSPVIITGSATCSHPNPLYEFWMLAQGSSTWRIVQPYSPAATYTWNSTGAAPGVEHFGVWVRDTSSAGANSSSMGSYDSLAGIPYSVVTLSCTSVGETAAPLSPSMSGTQVTFTATSSGCPNPRYEFWARWQGYSTWQLLQGYSASSVYNWNSTGAAAGTEYIGVWVRDASSRAVNDSYTSIPYSVKTTACTSVTLTASPVSPSVHGAGIQVTFTAVAAGCGNPNPQYEFWMMPAGSSTWQVIQGYTNTATYVWNTNGAPAGIERFGVWVRDSGSRSSWDALLGILYTLS